MNVIARIEATLGGRVISAEPVRGGYTHAWRRRVELADGRRVFVKHAVDDDTAAWLRTEHHLYSSVDAPFLAEVIAFDDDPVPMLVLEDLGHAHWPPPWRPGDVEAVIDALASMAEVPVPTGLADAADFHPRLHLWPVVAADPTPFLALGVASERWLDHCLEPLLAASAAAELGGDHLVHWDVRSDNMCRRPNGQVIFVDWNFGAVGNPVADRVAWLPSLAAEGGPAPDHLVADLPADEVTRQAALVAGYFAANAGLPIIERAPKVRAIQQVQLRTALPWAARRLDLPPPDLL